MSDIEFIESNKAFVKMQVKRCINDKTLLESYFLTSNIACDDTDYYITKGAIYSRPTTKKEIRSICRAMNAKLRLVGTANDMGYTRLIYNVVTKGT